MSKAIVDEKCEVLLWDEPLGLLVKKEGRYFFQFHPKAKISPSPIMVPLEVNRTFAFPDASFGLPGFIRDYIPGQYGQEVVKKYYKNNPTIIEMLCFVGDRGVGAISFKPQTASLEKRTIKAVEAYLKDREKLEKNYEDEALIGAVVRGSAQDGARPKIFCAIHKDSDEIVVNYGKQEPLPDGYRHIILKFDEHYNKEKRAHEKTVNDSHEQVLEYIYSILAKELGIVMPKTGLLKTKDSGTWFWAERFDIPLDGQIPHVHTFAGLIHDRSSLWESSYEELCRTALELGCSHADIEQIYKLMVFNIVFGNVDDHSRNFSFIMSKRGKWTFAPAYDLTPASADIGESNHLKVFEKAPFRQALVSADASREDLEDFANLFGIKGASEIIEHTCNLATNKLPLLMKEFDIERRIDETIKKIRNFASIDGFPKGVKP